MQGWRKLLGSCVTREGQKLLKRHGVCMDVGAEGAAGSAEEDWESKVAHCLHEQYR